MSKDSIERAIEVLDAAVRRWRSGNSLDDVASWLEAHPGVSWVDRFDGMVRFKPRGAMPLSIVSGDRFGSGIRSDPALDTGDVVGSVASPSRVRSRTFTGVPAGAFRRVSFERPEALSATSRYVDNTWRGDRPFVPAAVAGTTPLRRQVVPDQVIADNGDFSKKPTKRALVLGNFDWEFSPRETAEVSNRISLGREYQCEGCIDVRVTDYPRDHPLATKCNAEADGVCLPVQRTSWRDFLGWEEFDLIHVTTHGYQECRADRRCYTGIATGRIGATGELLEGAGRGTELGRLARYNLLRSHAGISRPGVEYVVTGPSSVCRDPVAVGEREARMGGGADPFDYSVNTPSSQAFDLLCKEMLWEVVTDDFFFANYPSGLSDKIIVLNACESFRSPHLVRHLAAGGTTSIFGWQVPVDAVMGLDIMKHFYSRLFPGSFAGGDTKADRGGGVRAGVAWADALKRYYRPLPPTATALPKSVRGRPTPDSSSFVDKRTMELVYLVDSESSEETKDGTSLRMLGRTGDGRPDSIAVKAEVHGLADEPDLAGFRIGFRVNGDAVPTTYPLSRRLGDEVWAFEGNVPLGRDAAPGERVDLDLSVDIPRGGLTRWLYKDLLLSAACSFSGRITEIRLASPRERFLTMLGEYHGLAVVDGDGRLTLSIEHEGNDATDHGVPTEVKQFSVHLRVPRSEQADQPMGRVVLPGAALRLNRPNRFYDPRHTERGGEHVFTSLQSPILSPAMSGTINVTAFTTSRVAGSLRVPFETNGAQVVFEATFDAGSYQSCVGMR